MLDNIDWTMLITKKMKDDKIEKDRVAILSKIESEWVASELDVVSEQLLMLEDDDPSALSGTSREWRDYRIALRLWKDGAELYPDSKYRPLRPK